MNPLFTGGDFLADFADYNPAIWPFQVLAYGLGLITVTAVIVENHALMRLGFAALAILWGFTGIGCHLIFFTQINPIAPIFAAFFVVQGVLLFASAIQPGNLRPRMSRDLRSIAGLRRLSVRWQSILPFESGRDMDFWSARCSASHLARQRSLRAGY